MTLIDLCGQAFGKLQVVCISDHRCQSGERYWVCECECGNICRARGGELRSGLKTCCPKCSYKDLGERRSAQAKAWWAEQPRGPKPPRPPGAPRLGRPPKPKPPEPPKPPKPPKIVYDAKADCVFYINDCQCDALKEMLCKKKGKCGFYKSSLENSTQE